MEKKYLLQCFLFLLTFKSFAQEIQVTDSTKWLCQYNYEFWQDSTSQNSLTACQMVLQIGSSVSKFTDIRNFLCDSIYFKNIGVDRWVTSDLIAKVTMGNIGNLMTNYFIYKNFPEKGKIFLKQYDDQKFYSVRQQMKMNWTLEAGGDTVILGYRCQKAFASYAGREYIAWFTTQIPISEGPYKFNGLPGLILKISDTKHQHCFSLVSIKKVNYFQPITFRLSDYVDISAEEYIKIMKNKMIRYFGTLQGGTVTFPNEEAKAKSLQGLKAKNNFIEKF